MAKCINKELPADIRVVNVFKVSKSFDGRKHCDKRTYDYLLPVRLLIPTEGAPRHFSKVKYGRGGCLPRCHVCCLSHCVVPYSFLISYNCG